MTPTVARRSLVYLDSLTHGSTIHVECTIFWVGDKPAIASIAALLLRVDRGVSVRYMIVI